MIIIYHLGPRSLFFLLDISASMKSSENVISHQVAGLPRAVLTSLGNKSARVVNWLAGLAEESRQGEGVRIIY